MMRSYLQIRFPSLDADDIIQETFVALAKSEDWDADDWADELQATLAHELTHHLEALGGLHGLDDRDALELERWRAEYAAEADASEE